MKTNPVLLGFFLALTAVHAEPTETKAVSENASTVSAATLKERLVESLKADMKAIGGAEADMRKSSTISKFISILQNENLTGTYESASNERLDYYLRSEGVSEKGAGLCADYFKKSKEEATAAKKMFVEEAVQSAQDALKKAVVAKSTREIQFITEEIQKLASQMDSRSGASEYQSQFYKLKSTLGCLRFRGFDQRVRRSRGRRVLHPNGR